MKPPKQQVRFSVIVFSACILFTFVLWNEFFNSSRPFDHTFAANLILLMGILFSAAAGLFAWSLETRQEYLEKEIQRKTSLLFQKNQESKNAEIAASAIYQTCHLLFSEARGESPLESIMDLMVKVLHADEGSLMLMDETRHLYIAASRGIPEDIACGTYLKMGERVAGITAAKQREFLIVDGLENYPEFNGLQPNPRIRSSVVCPLISKGEVLGVLNLSRTARAENFTVADLLSASIFSSQLAAALRSRSVQTQLHQRMAELESFQHSILEMLKLQTRVEESNLGGS